MAQAQHSIIVVEDEVIVAGHIEKKLKSRGYDVKAVVHSGEDAVRKAGELRPDLVLMDIRLDGEMDGVQAAEQIRGLFDIPVVYLTAYADEETLRRARITEPFGYIIKPYEARELHCAIEIAVYKHEMEQKLKASEERYALAARGANDGLWDWDLKTNQLYYSERWKNMVGLEPDEGDASPDTWLSRVHPDERESLKADLDAHIEGYSPHFQSEYRIMHKDGVYRWVFARGMVVRDENGKAYRMSGSQTDVTDRRMAEEQLMKCAFNDPMTELPNRLEFMRVFESMFYRRGTAEEDGYFALILVGLDEFGAVNREHGFFLGDQVLGIVGGRLRNIARNGDYSARLEGDVFAILSHGGSDEDAALARGREIMDLILEPVEAAGVSVDLRASIGMALSRDDYGSSDELFSAAETALRDSRKSGGNICSIRRGLAAG